MVLNYKYRIYPSDKNKIDNYIFEFNQAYNIGLNLIQTEGRKQYLNGIKSKDIFNDLYKRTRCALKDRDIADKSALSQDALRSVYNTLFTNIKQNKPFTLHFKNSSSLEGSFVFRTDKIRNKVFGVTLNTNFHRPIPEGYKILGSKIKRENHKYYIIYTISTESAELLVKPDITQDDIVGIDANQGNYTFSNGYKVDFLKSVYPELETKRLNAQKTLSSKKKRSKNRKKKQKLLFNISRKIKNRRTDDIQKRVTKILNETNFKIYTVEKLNIKKMTKKGPKANKGLTKNMLHIAHSIFFNCLDYKSMRIGRSTVKVNPAYTSQTCSRCGAIKQKTLSEREHNCTCGLTIDRDLNAAINIKRAGLALCS